MGDALKAAWRQLRRHQTNGWPTDRLIMDHERTEKPKQPQFGARKLYTRESGRLAASFIR
jgi:hypothetical protein